MEEGRKEAKEGMEVRGYFVGVKATENGDPERRTVIQAVRLSDALAQARILFPQTALKQPDDRWIMRNFQNPEFKEKMLEAWPDEKNCFLCGFMLPSEIQFWDTPRVLLFYKEKNVSGNWTK